MKQAISALMALLATLALAGAQSSGTGAGEEKEAAKPKSDPTSPAIITTTGIQPAPALVGSAKMKPKEGEKIPMLKITNAELVKAIRGLADLVDPPINLLFDHRLAARSNMKVNLELRDVTASQALSALLKDYDLIMVRDPETDIWRVTPKDAARVGTVSVTSTTEPNTTPAKRGAGALRSETPPGGLPPMTAAGPAVRPPDTGPMVPQLPGGGRTRYSAAPYDEAAMPGAGEDINGLFEEEANLNFEAAVNSYQSMIAQFDSQRPAVANAIFRLGECYRKLGRREEAKTQYARILREFPDQGQLVRLSQQHLFAERPRSGSPYSRLNPARTSSPGLPARSSSRPYYLNADPNLNPTPTPNPAFPPSSPDSAAGAAETRQDRNVSESALTVDGRLAEEMAQLRVELERAKVKIVEAKDQLQRAEEEVRAARSVDPKSLPSPAAADPRYQKLKAAYENLLLSGDSMPAVDKEGALKKAIEQIETWVRRIYLPEREVARSLAEERYSGSRSELDDLRRAMTALRDEAEKARQKARPDAEAPANATRR